MDILFCENSNKATISLNEETIKDLAIQEVIEAATIKEEEQQIIKKILCMIPQNIEDIKYRQEIMSDILENEELAKSLEKALDQIKVLRNYRNSSGVRRQNEATVFSLLEDMRELAVYVGIVEQISSCLEGSKPESKGLIVLRDELCRIAKDDQFKKAKADIEMLLKELSNVRSVMVGINLTPDLNIDEVADVEFNDYYFKPRVSFAEFAANIGIVSKFGTSGNSAGTGFNPFEYLRVPDPIMVDLAKLMDKRLKKYFFKLKRTLARYMNIDGYFVTDLLEGLTFYVVMGKLARILKDEGHKVCMPQLDDSGEFNMRDFYNARLAIRRETDIVLNDFSFTPSEKLFILTGPNRGGKTILEQGIGIASLMASVGTFVTAAECSGSPFGNILTHFPQDENLTINYGRLGEEAIRTREIAEVTNAKTLVLFNETYSTTSSADGLFLSKDLMHVMKDKGSFVIFNTHIHELACDIDEMNKWEGESDVVSIIMEIVDDQNTFRVKKSKPDRNSHARNVALKYGITYEQMTGKEKQN